MEILIPNHVGVDPVRVTACAVATCGYLVMLIQSHGALRFQHSMTPDQARDMAAALITMANSFQEVPDECAGI